MIEDIDNYPLKKLLQLIIVKECIKDQEQYMSEVSESLIKLIRREVSNLTQNDKDQSLDSFLEGMKSLDEFPSIRSELS